MVLAAFAHAGGSHEQSVMILGANGAPSFEQPGALVGWPAAVEAV